MERRWVVHIVDVRDDPQLQTCARCGSVLNVNQDLASHYRAGELLAIRHGQDRTDWRVIRSRDDLLPGEVPCEQAGS